MRKPGLTGAYPPLWKKAPAQSHAPQDNAGLFPRTTLNSSLIVQMNVFWVNVRRRDLLSAAFPYRYAMRRTGKNLTPSRLRRLNFSKSRRQ